MQINVTAPNATATGGSVSATVGPPDVLCRYNVECNAGRYSPDVATVACEACPAGRYQVRADAEHASHSKRFAALSSKRNLELIFRNVLKPHALRTASKGSAKLAQLTPTARFQ